MGWWLWFFWLWVAPSDALAQSIRAAEPREVHTELPATPPEWAAVPGTFLRVEGPPDLMPVLLRVARHGSEVLPAFAERLGVPIGMTIHVYVAPDDATFRALQLGRPPQWADATAWPELGAIFLRAPRARNPTDPEPLEQVLEHELVHVLVGRAFSPNDPPAWLQEGAAQLLANQLGPEESEILARASAGSGLIPLVAIERAFPRDPLRAKLAYAESADFLAFLNEVAGEEVLPKLLAESRQGGTMRQVVYRATGHLMEDLERDWKARHHTWSLRLAEFAKLDWLLGLGGLGLIVAGVRRLRDRRRRIEAMEDEDEDVIDGLIARWPERSLEERPPVH